MCHIFHLTTENVWHKSFKRSCMTLLCHIFSQLLAYILQGCTKRLFPGCIKDYREIWWISCVLFTYCKEESTIFHPIFTQPGKSLLEQPCIYSKVSRETMLGILTRCLRQGRDVGCIFGRLDIFCRRSDPIPSLAIVMRHRRRPNSTLGGVHACPYDVCLDFGILDPLSSWHCHDDATYQYYCHVLANPLPLIADIICECPLRPPSRSSGSVPFSSLGNILSDPPTRQNDISTYDMGWQW